MSELKISHLTKAFGALAVLKDISLTFAPGTVTALVGDNGAGKSTLLRTLAGVYQPTEGEIALGEKRLSGCSADEHRALGVEMVYQDLALARQQDVITNLFMGRERTKWGCLLDRKAMSAQAQEMLEVLGIKIPDLYQRVGLLSGGQQQAIAIARATLFAPQVLLLDEPTAALAAREVEKVLVLIRQQRELGRVVILVSHRLNDVLAVADRIVVLKHGALFSDDPRAEVTLSQVVERIVS